MVIQPPSLPEAALVGGRLRSATPHAELTHVHGDLVAAIGREGLSRAAVRHRCWSGKPAACDCVRGNPFVQHWACRVTTPSPIRSRVRRRRPGERDRAAAGVSAETHYPFVAAPTACAQLEKARKGSQFLASDVITVDRASFGVFIRGKPIDPEAVSARLAKVIFNHSRDVGDIKLATSDGQHELLGVIDGEFKIAAVQQAERAGGRPR